MRRSVVTAGLVALLGLATAPAGAQEASWIGRDSRLQVQPFQDPAGQFAFEMPRRDWELAPGGGPIVATLLHRRFEAVVFVEHARLNQPLAPEDITDLFAELEVDRLRQQQPGVVDVEARILDVDDRRIVALQYQRRGPKGPETVRQYSIAEGDDLYRLVCTAQAARFGRYESVFKHVVTTFRPLGGR